MFKVTATPAYWGDVTVNIPADDGKADERKFKAKFRRLTQTELDETMAGINAGTVTDQQLVNKVLLDWKGVQDDDGADIPFNESTVAQVLDVYPVRPSVVAAFFKTINGARQKN